VSRRSQRSIAEHPGYAAMAGARAGEIAAKLLADQGLRPGDVDLVVANPLTEAFVDALAARLGVDRSRMVEPAGRPGAHTAGLASLSTQPPTPGGWTSGPRCWCQRGWARSPARPCCADLQVVVIVRDGRPSTLPGERKGSVAKHPGTLVPGNPADPDGSWTS
jgi:hypothetical protein